jgi:hypothetical protein
LAAANVVRLSFGQIPGRSPGGFSNNPGARLVVDFDEEMGPGAWTTQKLPATALGCRSARPLVPHSPPQDTSRHFAPRAGSATLALLAQRERGANTFEKHQSATTDAVVDVWLARETSPAHPGSGPSTKHSVGVSVLAGLALRLFRAPSTRRSGQSPWRAPTLPAGPGCMPAFPA